MVLTGYSWPPVTVVKQPIRMLPSDNGLGETVTRQNGLSLMHINGGSDESTESPGGLGLERGPGWMQQPVRYGDLVLSGETISTRVPDAGVAPVDNWPAACSLIEQDEVGSLLPGAKVNLVAKDVEVI